LVAFFHFLHFFPLLSLARQSLPLKLSVQLRFRSLPTSLCFLIPKICFLLLLRAKSSLETTSARERI